MCRGVIDIEAKTQQGQEAQSMLGRRGGGVRDFCGFQWLFALFFPLALCFSSFLNQLFSIFGLKRDKSPPQRCGIRCTRER